MISAELKAQAVLAWQNWTQRNPGQSPGLTEDEFVGKFEELQHLRNTGNIAVSDWEERINQLLTNPPMAVSVATYEPPQRDTNDLLNELIRLKASGVLNDEEFAERKAELFFMRGVEEDPDETAGEDPTARQERLGGYLDELHKEGILNQMEYETAKGRLRTS